MIGHRVTSLHRLSVLILVGVMVTAVQVICVVMATAGPPTEAIRRTNERVVALVQDEDLGQFLRTSEQRQRLVDEVGKRYSCEDMSKRSLGDYWERLDDKQRQEFRSVFQALLAKTYVSALWYFSKIERHGGQPMQYIQERIRNGYAEVLVRIAFSKEQLLVTFRLVERAGDWVVYDVMVNGVSLIDNLRAQIVRMLAVASYEQLLGRILEKGLLPLATPHQR
jgi:phospholipid transport system substrate-binding protein